MGKRDHGTGGIYKRKDGTYTARIQVGKRSNGRPNKKAFYGKTEAEVKRKLREFRRNMDKYQPESVCRLTVTEYFYNWLLNNKRYNLKDTSYDRLERTIENQILPAIGNVLITQVISDDIQGLLNSLIDDKASYSVVKKTYYALNELFRFASLRGDIAKNPMLTTEAASIEETENSTDAAEPAALDADGNAEYENKKSDLDIRLAKKAKKNNMVKIKGDGYQVSWGFPGISKSKVEFINNNEKLEGNDKFLVRKNLVQEALYKDAFPNVDMQYLVTPVGVKENIILKNKDAQTSFTIEYKTSGLTATKKNGYTIELKNKDGIVVYEIYAPFMTDNKGEKSTQLGLEIKSQKKNKLTVMLSADREWLDEAVREYPVTVDPTFVKGQEWQAVECAYVDSSNPTKSYGYGSATGYTGTVDVGTYGSGVYRTFIRIKNLPQLNKGDIVVDAHLNMHLTNKNFHTDMYINSYQVTSSWTQSTVSWNWMKSTKRFEDKISDYDKITVENQANAWRKWNITSNVKRWYNGEANYGLMLKDASEGEQCAEFYSSNYPSTSIPRPVFEITYRNNKGLEGNWGFTEFDVGNAGTAYINDYSGNLVFVHKDAATAGDRMPVSIEHVFNNYMAGITYDKAPPLTGKGWRISIQQTLLPSSEYGLTGDSAKIYPYVYTDGDGTEHYFYEKKNNSVTEYVDEDGLKLKLTVDDGNPAEKYKIKGEKDSVLIFNSKGLLQKLSDANGNSISVNYTSDGKKIQNVKDGAGKTITFVPNSNGSGSLSRMTDPAGRQCIFYYTTEEGHSGYMSQIKNPDGKSVLFTYDNDGSLTSVKDVDGYSVTFGYSSSNKGKQVTSIQEYGKDGTTGQKITFDRSKYNTTIIHSAGVDGVYGNTDDLITTMQFDNYGRTTSVIGKVGNEDLGAAGCQFTSGTINATASNINQINKISKEYSLGENAINLLANHNMETTGSWTSASWGGTNTFTAVNTTAQKYIGKQSMKINVTAVTASSSGRIYQDISSTVLKPNTTYTLSAYVKTTGFNTTDPNYGALIGATSFNSAGTATDRYSQRIQCTPDTAINSGWRRLVLTFKVPADSSKTRINLALRGTVGTAYFDAVQLEEGSMPNSYNMLENSSLDKYGTGNLPVSWAGNALAGDDKKDSEKKDGTFSFKIVGDPSKDKEIYQSVNVTGSPDDTYIVSGWAKAEAAIEENGNNKKFKLSIKIVYSDGTSEWKQAAEFNRTVSDWQYTSTAFTLKNSKDAKKTPSRIEIYAVYNRQINSAFFDNIQLIKDVAQSYTYDDKGKLITTQKNAEQKANMEYIDANLTKSVDAKGFAYTYSYDKKHNMTKATSQRGVTYNYSYDTTGRPTRLEAKNTAGDASVLSTAEYTGNKDFVSKVTDQNGYALSFDYDTDRGVLRKSTDSTGTITRSYNEQDDSLQNMSKELTEDGYTVSTNFYYTNGGNLSKIVNNGTNYTMAYDEFNNLISSSIGNQVIKSNTFAKNNGLLQKTTYGNGNYENYTYDCFNNINTQSYNGTVAFKWYSDKSGALTRHQDIINQIQYDYDYDVTSRLVRENAVDLANNKSFYLLEYGYDQNDNISKLVNITGNKTARNEYTYGKDNLIEKYTIDGSRNITYSYDSLNRLTKTSIATAAPLDMEYSYHLSERNTGTSTKYKTTSVSEETIAGQKYSYEYDEQGNIIRINKMKNGTLVPYIYYEYDQLNQLYYDMNYEANILKQYRYDEGGNLTTESTSKMVNGRPASTAYIDYGYEDSEWTNKLTIYNGENISYDAIGNPLSYRDGMTMTWQHGRELSSLKKGERNIFYTYDSESVRSSKTVDGERYTYQYKNGKLLHETRGQKSFHYYYDSAGLLTAIKYRLTPDGQDYAYYATHNWRGDVLGLYNGNGVLVAQYEYDSWGNVLSLKNAAGAEITDQNHVGNLNPFRYRGYYMDTETGLYYLMSRYYDPVTHRFVNGDSLVDVTEIQNNNTFAYCANNPVNNDDPTGEFLHVLAGAAIGGAFSVGWQMLVEHKSIDQVNWIDVGASALSGGLAATGAGVLVQFLGNGIISGAQTALSGGNMDEIVLSAGIGAASSLIGGRGANYDKAITAPLATIKREARRANQKYASKVISAANKELAGAIGSSGTRYVGSQVAQRGSTDWLYSNGKPSGGSGGKTAPKKKIPIDPVPLVAGQSGNMVAEEVGNFL